jgi:hypothetical protein
MDFFFVFVLSFLLMIVTWKTIVICLWHQYTKEDGDLSMSMYVCMRKWSEGYDKSCQTRRQRKEKYWQW